MEKIIWWEEGMAITMGKTRDIMVMILRIENWQSVSCPLRRRQ
jgi:hypothetical protein